MLLADCFLLIGSPVDGAVRFTFGGVMRDFPESCRELTAPCSSIPIPRAHRVQRAKPVSTKSLNFFPVNLERVSPLVTEFL